MANKGTLDKKQCYKGNQNLRGPKVEIPLSLYKQRERLRAKKDIIYFAEKFVKIVSVDDGTVPFKMYDYQKKMVQHIADNRYTVIKCCRQSGKCVDPNTVVRIRSKITGEVEEITIGELYQRQKMELERELAELG